MSSHSKHLSHIQPPATLSIQENNNHLPTNEMLDFNEGHSDLSFQTDTHSIQPLPPTPQRSTTQHSPPSQQPLENSISKIPTPPPKETNSARNSQVLELVSPTSAAANTSNSHKKSRRSIGPYQLTRTLGSGSMGKVKLAINTQTGEKFAVKVIPRKPPINDTQPKDEFREIRIHREIALLMLLNHPYIVSMKEAMIMPSHYYLFFEYVSGGQILDYIISHGKIKEKQARKFARQMLSAIEYCHRNSVVHRDLKIENILITEDGNIKIIDFGLSNLFSSNSQLSTFCGSLYFAAPELLNAKQYRGPEVDIWSLGIVFYVLVCGRVPFDDQSMPALHAKIKKGHVVYPNWLSKDCKHLLSRMLVTNSAERATMAELLRHPWINKGYEEPVDIHFPIREPLTLPLDPEIIRRMKGFDFGTEEHIQSEIESSIISTQPKKETHNFLDHNSKMLTDLKKKAFFGRSKSPPPTNHPMVSIYYLVMEKMQRETELSNKIYPRSPIVNQEELTPTDSSNEKHLRPIPPKRPQSFSPGATTSGQALNSKDSNRTIKFDEDANMKPDDTPGLSSKSSKMLRRLSSAVRVRPPVFHRFSHGPESDTEGKPPSSDKFSRRFSKLINRRFTMQDSKLKRNSMSELDMLVGTNDSHNQTDAPSNPNDQAEELVSPRSVNITHLDLPTSPNDPNSAGYNQVNSHDNEGEFKDEMAEVSVKSMSLRGLFSVSTTSTKKLSAIKADLQRVLNELNIVYREKEGYLQCYYSNSDNPNGSPSYLDAYDDSAILEKETVKSPRKTPVNAASPQPLSPLNPQHANRKSINGMQALSTSQESNNIEVSSENAADIPSTVTPPEKESNESNNERLPARHVLFQIHIVKIKVLLRLYGIQFRRLEGPSWEYKALCSSILQKIKL